MGASDRAPELPALTGLRFFAALWVVLYHYGQSSLASLPDLVQPFALHFIQNGYVGVSLFFVLSGYVLGYNYAELARGSSSGQRWKFWRARFARTAPLYWFAWLVSLPQYAQLSSWNTWEASLRAILRAGAEFLAIHAWVPPAVCSVNCPDWSLSVEAFLYLCTPFLLLYLTQVGAKKMVLLLGGFAMLLPLVYLAKHVVLSGDHYWDDVWFRVVAYQPLWHVPQFSVGLIAGRAYRTGYRLPAAGRMGAAAVVLALAVWLCVARPSYVLLNNGLLALPFAVVLLWLSVPGRCQRLLGSQVLTVLGKSSYAIYLLQVPVMFAFTSWLGDRATSPQGIRESSWLGGLYVLLLLACSLLAHRLIEEPARRRLR